MKKLLIIASLALSMQAYCAIISTNISGDNGSPHLLSVSRGSIYNIQLSSAYDGSVTFYDCSSIAEPYYGTNYVISDTYTNRSTSYATNYVTSYVGSNGYTNWYTNAGIWTLTGTTAASTNALTPIASFVFAAGTVGNYNVDVLFAQGLTARISTNVSMVINYKPGK